MTHPHRLLPLGAFSLAALAACATPPSPTGAWVVTWGAAPQLTEPANLPPSPGLPGATLRQVIHVSLGGPRIRIEFSNAFGSGPVTLAAAAVAPAGERGAIKPEESRPLLFGGGPAVTIAPGGTAVSDPIDFAVRPLSDLTISIFFGDVSHDVTGHPGSRTTSYLQKGDFVSAASLPGAATTQHWYILSGVEVWSGQPAGVLAILGDSITDGRGSTTDQNRRWPDNLARRLQAHSRTAGIAVLNQGIGGNRLLHDGLGPSALSRLDRDVLNQNGVRWLIVFEGVNDIGTGPKEARGDVAQKVIAAYEDIVRRAHARHVRVFGATITPFGGSFYDTPAHEANRETVNQWIRTSGQFDAVIDFDAVARDPSNPTCLLPALDCGDHLHLSDRGYEVLAESVELNLLTD